VGGRDDATDHGNEDDAQRPDRQAAADARSLWR
jgi:hypothetical protein